MTVAIELLWLPFLACLVLTGIHVYLGLHVLARGVIFVDLALAQVAALGMTVALLAGHAARSPAAAYYAVAFTAGGAALFALARGWADDDPSSTATAPRRLSGRRPVPQEAIIGTVYAVAAAVTVLVLDRLPQGGEQIKEMLVGSILVVTPTDVVTAAALYAAVAALHSICRRPLLALSFGAEPPPTARWWDFLFYFTFGLVVVSSVRIAGVLLVFSYLIVPAVIATTMASRLAVRLAVGWTVGFVVSVGGLTASYVWDLPTGAAVVATFGGALALVGIVRAVGAAARHAKHRGPRALAGVGVTAGVIIALAGALLALAPGADHVWLDALEAGVPHVRTTFLTPHERRVESDTQDAIARAVTELQRLRALEADVHWGARDMAPEQRERLRQFVTGRSEIAAGDRLVLGTLRRHARERQRLAVGLPVAGFGLALAVAGWRFRRPRLPSARGSAAGPTPAA